jgi:hypothetical protein
MRLLVLGGTKNLGRHVAETGTRGGWRAGARTATRGDWVTGSPTLINLPIRSESSRG